MRTVVTRDENICIDIEKKKALKITRLDYKINLFQSVTE